MLVGDYKYLDLDDDNFKVAFDWIRKEEWKNLEVGTYEIKGRDVYAMVQQYDSYDSSVREFESHSLYADIQMVICGIEKLFVISDSRELGTISKPYAKENDIVFYKADINKSSELVMTEGLAVVLYPSDAHMPCIRYSESMPIKKLVMKVKLS